MDQGLRKSLLAGFHVTEEMMRAIEGISFPEKEYDYLKKLVWEAPDVFCRVICGSRQYRRLFLKLYLDFALDAYEEYRRRGIPYEIYAATMQDITLWAENCRRTFGETGIQEYEWLWRHVTLKLFRLGRLQFEILNEKELNLHIPQGEALSFDKCKRSIEEAFDFFGGGRRIFCYSWLLNPKMKELLPEKSNIVQFQTLFRICRTDEASRQAEERVFGKICENPEEYPENTLLQRNLKQYLQQKRRFGSAYGEVVYEP